MNRLLQIAAALVLAFGINTASVQDAQAGKAGRYIVGGLIGGLIVGSIIANSRRSYGGPVYGYTRTCYRGARRCWWRKRTCWRDSYGYRHCRKARRVCRRVQRCY